MQKRLVLLLAVILFCSTVELLSHHHADGTTHGDCPICVASQHQAAALSPESSNHAPVFATERSVSDTPVFQKNILTSFSSSRAPPA
jgi:hypothetical protein